MLLEIQVLSVAVHFCSGITEKIKSFFKNFYKKVCIYKKRLYLYIIKQRNDNNNFKTIKKLNKMKTTIEAVELLIALRNREINNAEYFRTQSNFDDYVDSWMKNSGCEENEETLKECAFNAVEYDGFDYLIEE